MNMTNVKTLDLKKKCKVEFTVISTNTQSKFKGSIQL